MECVGSCCFVFVMTCILCKNVEIQSKTGRKISPMIGLGCPKRGSKHCVPITRDNYHVLTWYLRIFEKQKGWWIRSMVSSSRVRTYWSSPWYWRQPCSACLFRDILGQIDAQNCTLDSSLLIVSRLWTHSENFVQLETVSKIRFIVVF